MPSAKNGINHIGLINGMKVIGMIQNNLDLTHRQNNFAHDAALGQGGHGVGEVF